MKFLILFLFFSTLYMHVVYRVKWFSQTCPEKLWPPPPVSPCPEVTDRHSSCWLPLYLICLDNKLLLPPSFQFSRHLWLFRGGKRGFGSPLPPSAPWPLPFLSLGFAFFFGGGGQPASFREVNRRQGYHPMYLGKTSLFFPHAQWMVLDSRLEIIFPQKLETISF